MSAGALRGAGLALILAAVAAIGGADAQMATGSLAVRDSFRIGNTGVLCTAQSTPLDAAAPGTFDRAYAIVCRDAATAVGKLYALRSRGTTAADFVGRRGDALECAPPAAATVDGVSGAMVADCTRKSDGLPYRIYTAARSGRLYVAEGLRGYDSAVSLGLRTIVADRPVAGAVEVATTAAGDPAAFARTQAGTLDAESAAAEGYARNNSGSYAESAEFFGRLVETGSERGATWIEYLLNYGLQQSNLGNFAAADKAFGDAEERGVAGDPVLGRLLRNYRAMNELNQRDGNGALRVLAAPVARIGADNAALSGGTITEALADQINRGAVSGRRVGALDARLSPLERARILDAQAQLLRGTALRLTGKRGDALTALAASRDILRGVRGGRVASAAFLQSEALAESALVAEAGGDYSSSDRDLAQAMRLVEASYPQSAAALMAKARLAAFRARHGNREDAMALYGEVVAGGTSVPGGIAPFKSLLRPYFALLAQRSATDPNAVAALFAVNQLLVRPGLSQTQAVLARELSGGDDAAARLFRESLNRQREVARASGDVAALAAQQPKAGSGEAAALDAARAKLADLERDQVAVQAQLAAYPRYRVIDPATLALADLQKALKPGEAYYELRFLEADAYALLITPTTARAFKVASTPGKLGADVAALRRTIVRSEGSTFVTDPFDVALSRKLYTTLFGPFDADLKGVTHLIYEADGALLQLPPNLLVTDQASVERYTARAKRPGGDAYDFTGIAWLGRGRDVTTAVSPRGFVDVRQAAASRATKAYLGLGSNAPPNVMASFLASGPAAPQADPCAWPVKAWTHPISPDELYAGEKLFGANRSTLVVGPDFSDTAVEQRNDLNEYRIVHFATHGLVTAPRPDCPARPALLTSFGAAGSDGLLSFREIYDLRMDADLVILSACDTAGAATAEATREAGVATGGNFALDGLVRAFVGAGARTLVASHWPVPDDYDATKRLILGTLGAAPGTPVATALRKAETQLMDDPKTSHPYYWAAFAVIGDGERPVSVRN